MSEVFWSYGMFDSQPFRLLWLVLCPSGRRVVIYLADLRIKEFVPFDDISYGGFGYGT